MMYCQSIDSPLGILHLVVDDDAVRAIAFDNNWADLRGGFGALQDSSTHPLLERTRQQLQDYFAGERREFDLPLATGGTPFQQQTWQALLKIPYGETRTYSQQATLLGNPQAVRAIGRTNGLNPISIVIPCHRVIGKSGSLTGYAGGLDAKRFLLDLESRHVPFSLQ